MTSPESVAEIVKEVMELGQTNKDRQKTAIQHELNDFLASHPGTRYMPFADKVFELVQSEKKIYRMITPEEARELESEEEEEEGKEHLTGRTAPPVGPKPDPSPKPTPPIFIEDNGSVRKENEDGSVTTYVEKVLDRMNSATSPAGKNIEREN